MATGEALTLDGLALNADAGPFRLLSMEAPPPKQRAEWISAADSEGAALMRGPQHENREITLRVTMDQQADITAALVKINQVVDKLAKANVTTDGIPLVWTPATTIYAVTFDVLAGEIEELPITWESGWFSKRPEFTVKLTCKPYWRGTETSVSSVASTAPIMSITVPSVAGDVPALGRLVVTDLATQNRRFMEWGLEQKYYNASAPIIIDSDSLVTTGLTGTQTTLTGAYDANGTGNSIITASVSNVPVGIASTGNQLHVGQWRVRARIYGSTFFGTLTPESLRLRLAWREGDNPTTLNSWVVPPIAKISAFQEVDLGVINISDAVAGGQQWTGRVDAYILSGSCILYLDYLKLIPASEGYGKARTPSPAPTIETANARDNFVGTTNGGSLNTRVAPVGGTWVTSGGSATDFQFNDAWGPESVSRGTTSENFATVVGARVAVLGTTNYTNMSVGILMYKTQASPATCWMGLVARWTDSNNHVRCGTDSFGGYVLDQVSGGVFTRLAEFGAPPDALVPHRMSLTVYTSGQVYMRWMDESGTILRVLSGTSPDLATGGALASGKGGFFDYYPGAPAASRYYRDFVVGTPSAEQVTIAAGQSLEVRHDDVIREDAAGTIYGRPGSYRGSRLLVPPAGADNKTSRVVVHAHRNDLDTSEHTPLGDNLQAQLFYTPRGLVVPR